MFAHRGEFPRLISLVEVRELHVTGVGLLWIVSILAADGAWDACASGLCGIVLFVSGVWPMSGMN